MPRRWLAMAAVLAAAAMLAACTSESTTAPAGSPAPATPAASPHPPAPSTAAATPAPAPSPSPSAAPADTGEFASLGLTIDADTRWGDVFETLTAAEQACFRDEFGDRLDETLEQPIDEGGTVAGEVAAFGCLAPATARAVFLDALLAGMAADDVELGAAERACLRQTVAAADIAAVIAADREGDPVFFEFSGALLACMPEVFLDLFLLNTGLAAAGLDPDERACLLEAWDAGDWVALSTGDEVASVSFALDLYSCVPAFYLSGMLGEEVTLSEADTACLRAAFASIEPATLISVYEGRANAAGAVFGEVMSCVPDRILLHVFGAELGRELGEAEASCLRESFAGLDWSGLRVVDPDAVIAAEMVRCVPDLLLLAMLEQAGAGLEGVSEDELACMRAWAAEVDAGEQLLALAAGGDIVELGAGFFACAPHLLVSMADSALAGGGDDATPVAVGTSVDAVLDAADLAAVFAFAAERGVLYQVDVAPATLTAPAGHVAAPPGSATITVEGDDALPSTTLRYDTYDLTGAVTSPGSYAFLSGESGTTAVTTYEGLRDGTAARLLIHQTDAGGTSRSAFYDTVEPGDLLEWRRAADCFVRYQVTQVKPDSAGTVPRKLLAVEWMTYAFTGCSGRVPASVSASVVWGPLPDLGGTSLTVPVRHGEFQLVPDGWTGAVEPGELRERPAHAPEYPGPGTVTEDLDEARTYPYWREPELPADWTFSSAIYGGYQVSYGYCARYVADDGYLNVEVCGEHAWGSVNYLLDASWRVDGLSGETLESVHETRRISGRPAVVSYSPEGPNHHATPPVRVRVYDAATQSVYTVIGRDPSLRGSNVAGAITIARSLFEGSATVTVEDDDPLPSTTLRYDTYDLTGAVTSPGSYAFLSGESGTTAVTTYEGLRDGTTTRLLIHTTDAGGTSRAAYYDTVQAGDLFEWRRAADCFVRYQVTEVKANLAGTAPRKLLAVEWTTYAFTGCSGAIPANTSASVMWGMLPNLGGTSLTAPIVHGPFQRVPAGWTGSVQDSTYHAPPGRSAAAFTRDAAEARRLTYWRVPELPAGWTLDHASSGDVTSPPYGYCAQWTTADSYAGVEICGGHMSRRVAPGAASNEHGVVYETRVIAGRPALARYVPAGPGRSTTLSVIVWVYDADTQCMYTVTGHALSLSGSNVDPVIAIARSLFE